MALKVHGHALKPMDTAKPYQWECNCGANGAILAGPSAGARERGRKMEHDDHKIEVLRRQGKLEDDNE